METTINEHTKEDVLIALGEFNKEKKEINDLEKKLKVPEKEWLTNNPKYKFCLQKVAENAKPVYVNYITGILKQYKANLIAKLEDIPPN